MRIFDFKLISYQLSAISYQLGDAPVAALVPSLEMRRKPGKAVDPLRSDS
jgi:hypothetical protein